MRFVSILSVMMTAVVVPPAFGASREPTAFLELCYATSVNLPEQDYGPGNVFDGDTATCWATMPGAAPDEGLYFSFLEPVMVRSIKVDLVPGSDEFETVESYQLYVNGVEGGVRYGDAAPVWLNVPVRTVFIRIRSTESMDWDRLGIRNKGDLPVGIREVTLIVEDPEGQEVPLRIVPVSSAAGSVTASSSLEPVEAYSPDFLFDSRPAFGWADGDEDHSGEGENLMFEFDSAVHIEKLMIWNGYHRSASHFQQNERVARFSFGPYGEDPGVYDLEDSMEPQVVELEYPLDGERFMMDFLDVYPGDVYRDLVMSELRFFDGREWFIVDTGGSLARKMEILDWADEAVAGGIVDRQLYYRRSGEDDRGWEYYAQTLVLRSNGSFVIWIEEEWEDGEEHLYADGNWQVLDGNTVRIFGRLQRVARSGMEPYDPYAGSWPGQGQDTQRLTIFSDTLHVTGSSVTSDRGLFEEFLY